MTPRTRNAFKTSKAIPKAVRDLIDWTNLADMNDDGKINKNDIKVFTTPDGTVEIAAVANKLELDVTNGDLDVGTEDSTTVGWLEFHLNELTTISGRAEATKDSTDVRANLIRLFSAQGKGEAAVDVPGDALKCPLPGICEHGPGWTFSTPTVMAA